MQKIRPCLWFEERAEEAVKFYVDLFDGKILYVSRYGDAGPLPKGEVMVINFEIQGQEIMVLHGGPYVKFNDAVSLVARCKDQAEVDRYWNALIADGGEEKQCAWLKDKFGLSWQIVPDRLIELMSTPDAAANARVMQAMLKMKKIVIADLEKAAAS
jgi:predicted 3-demethylubiquinone-9 3-methyltransferase (glyoxalase superfamily)